MGHLGPCVCEGVWSGPSSALRPQPLCGLGHREQTHTQSGATVSPCGPVELMSTHCPLLCAWRLPFVLTVSSTRA